MAEESKRKLSISKFFKEMKTELKKVIWPDRKQLTNNTVTVLLACFLVGAIIWIADLGLGELAAKFLLK